MAWLESMDVGLFRLINGGLSHPWLDALMPFASGNDFFKPAVLLAALVLAWKGGTRGRLCVLFMALALLVDGLVCHPLKEALARPRPFLALADVHLLAGRGRSYSMPSSHAANWFAAGTMAFLFYRRSWRFVLPLALLVMVSRVYNGVHYPSDVLAGAAIGTGFALGAAWLVESAWQGLGRRWFPLWWQALPSLLLRGPAGAGSGRGSTRTGAATLPAATPDQHYVRLGCGILLTLLLARLAYLATGTLELSGDEAYQWTWSLHPALSYYSKPPMIAVLQWLGTHLWGDTELGVRFCAPVISALLGLVVLRFLAREVDARTGLVAVLLLNATPLMAAGSILMTIDPPLVLFWTLAMLAGWRAAQPDGRTGHWLVAGGWLGLAFLSKYSAFYQVVCWLIFFALWPPARVHLRRPGPYLALLVFAVCLTPVLVWNAQHGWITVKHVGDNAGVADAWRFAPKFMWDFLLAEAGLLNPILFGAAAWAGVALWKRERRNPLLLFFFSMGVPVFLGHFFYSFCKRIQPNWIAPAVLPLACLAVVYWNLRWRAGVRAVPRWLLAALLLGGGAVVLLHDTRVLGKVTGWSLPASLDPLNRVRGWRETARQTEAARQKLEAEGKPAFIVCQHYSGTGQLSFYLPDARAAARRHQPLVYVLQGDRPRNQFFFWPEYRYRDHRRGQNAIFMHTMSPDSTEASLGPESLRREFASVESLGVFEVRDGKAVCRKIQLFACRNLQ